MLEYFKHAQPESVYFEFERDPYDDYDYDSSDPCFTLDRMQTDEEYAKDIAIYEKRLARYKEWYKENEEEVVAEVAQRKIEAEEKSKKDAEKSKKQLEKQRKVLEKSLAHLNKRLQK